MKYKRSLMGSAVPVLSWRETARTDLWMLVEYIADDNPDAAQELKDEIEAKVSELSRFPQMYRQGRVVGTREMVNLADLSAHVPLLPAVRWKLYNIAELRQHPRKHKAALVKLEKCLGL